MIEQKTILYISDGGNNSNSVVAAIKETGCEVVTTNSPTEGVALLYIMGHVDAVVLESRVREHANFNVAQSLRTIRPNVPVILQCADEIDISPLSKESCVRTDKLPSALEDCLTAESFL
jgi:DNA-binding NtrC family response regulator